MKKIAAAVVGIATIASFPAFAAQIVSGTIFEEEASCSVSGGSFCFIQYANLPSLPGKIIRIDTVSCQINTSKPVRSLSLSVQGGAGSTRRQFGDVPNRSGTFTFNSKVSFAAGASSSRYLTVELGSEGTVGDTFGGGCTVSGTIGTN